jgi:hypothetical protein
MDKSSPVFENFENKMAAMSGRPKINRSTFKIGAGGLEGRVANNEKKITTLKNIFKAQRAEIGEKITPKVNVLEESLINTNLILADVARQLEKDFSNRIKTEKLLLSKERQDKLDRKREDKEGRIETKKIGKIANSIGSTIVKPFSSILDKLLQFGQLFLAGVGVNAALSWLSDPKNMERFKGILKAIQDKPLIALGTLGGTLFIINKAISRTFGALKSFVGQIFKFIRNPKKFITEFGPKVLKLGNKIANETPTKFLLGKVGRKVAEKTGLKAFGAIPVLGDIVDLGVAIYRFSQGDIAGGFLSLGSAIPFVGWGFAALDIAREFNAPFLKGSILDKKRFDAQKEKERVGSKKDSRAGFTGTSVSPGKEYRVNDNGELEYFQPLVPGNVFSSTQVERKLRTESGASSYTFLELPMLNRTSKKQISQPEPGDSTLSENPDITGTHGINHFISEFNIMTELGEKV